MSLEINFGVPEKQRLRVAKILYEAFETKFQRFFGVKHYSSLIAEHLRNDRLVVALSRGVVVGFGGLKFEGKEWFDIGFWQLLRELNFNIFRVLFLGTMFIDRVEKREILLDVLAVSRDMRGEGIGTRILDYVIDFARSNDFRKIKLSVVDTNKRARRLYERIGFKVSRIRRIPFPLNRLVGINSAHEMIYHVQSDFHS